MISQQLIGLDSLQNIVNNAVSHRLMDASKPWYFLLIIVANGVWYLPLIMLVSKQWRSIMGRFMHGDDAKYDKVDRKDAAIDAVAFYVVAFSVHIITYDLIYRERHWDYVALLLGVMLTMWGFKEIAIKHKTEKS